MEGHHLLILGLHSFLEVCPISSSWHLKYLGATKTQIHNFHIWLFPVVMLYALSFRHKSQLFKLPLGIIFWSIMPTAAIYFLLKFQIFSPVTLPASNTHLLMGALLVAISWRQKTTAVAPISVPSAWVASGLLQSLALLIPGSSRLGFSLGYALFYRIDFLQAFVISFSLNLITLAAGATLDVAKGHFVLPSLLEVLIASLLFLFGIRIAHKGQWAFIAACGCYRLLLGLWLLA